MEVQSRLVHSEVPEGATPVTSSISEGLEGIGKMPGEQTHVVVELDVGLPQSGLVSEVLRPFERLPPPSPLVLGCRRLVVVLLWQHRPPQSEHLTQLFEEGLQDQGRLTDLFLALRWAELP